MSKKKIKSKAKKLSEEEIKKEKMDKRIKTVIDALIMGFILSGAMLAIGFVAMDTDEERIKLCAQIGMVITGAIGLTGFKEFKFKKEEDKYKQYFGGAGILAIITILLFVL